MLLLKVSFSRERVAQASSVQRIWAILGHPSILGYPIIPEMVYLQQFLRKREDTLYAGSGGLYASTDDGDTWHHVPTFQKRVSVSGVVIIGDRIYISMYEDGVWYSDDDGDSWHPDERWVGKHLNS